MQQAQFRFYAELNDFLPRSRRQAEVAYPFRGSPAVKDAVEALGVPHTEVEVILVNGVSVPFDHPLRDGDRVSVFPVFETLDATPWVRLRPQALPQVRFLDAFWHEARAELWVYSSGKSSCDLVRELFHKTFCEPLDLTLVPLSPPLFGITDADLADEQHGLISRLKRVLPSGRQEEDTRDQVDTAVSGSAAPLG